MTIRVLSLHWEALSVFQKEVLLLVVQRWTANGADEMSALYSVLFKEYAGSNSLEYKYSLHSVLSCYNSDEILPDQIDFTAVPIKYRLPSLQGSSG